MRKQQTERVGTRSKRTLPLSVLVGTLLVPLSAVAALVMAGSPDSSERDTTSQSSASSIEPTDVGFSLDNATDDDLAAACGPAGQELVALEENGTISGLQQAALDAIREICEQEGMALPGKPAPAPVVQTVVLTASGSSNTAPAATTLTSGDDREVEDEEKVEVKEPEKEEDHEPEEDGH